MPLCRLLATIGAIIAISASGVNADAHPARGRTALHPSEVHENEESTQPGAGRAAAALRTRAPARHLDRAALAPATRAPALPTVPARRTPPSASRTPAPPTAPGIDPGRPLAPPAPAVPASADPGGEGLARAHAALDADVPAAWRAAIAPRLSAIAGSTSWSRTDGLLQFGTSHLAGDWQHLRAVVTHEFGHLVAYRYGSQAFLGAAPIGFASTGNRPEELWADCVARSLTGNVDPSHGLAPCDGASLAFAQAFLASGPSAHPRTG